MIYFDYTATSKPNEEVLALYQKINADYWSNPSSIYKAGVITNNLFQKCEKDILEVLNLQNKKIYFTSGATEANNLAIYGICNNYLNQDKNIITTKIEHPSVMSCFEDLEKKGFKVTYLSVDEKGIINLEELKQNINNNTILVSTMWVNNIVGTIEPIEEVIKIVKQYPRCKLHVDAVQGIGKIKPTFDFNNVDMFTLSSHKINGLKSSGALIINNKINLQGVLKGATQQEGIRPGTIDVALSAATTKALKLITASRDKHYIYVKELQKYFREQLKNIPNVLINSSEDASPYILNISILNTESETFIHYLEKYEIYVAAGSACNSKIKKPEKTVYAMFHDERRAVTSLRISLSYVTTKEEIDEFIKRLKEFK
ncbi:MAG: cysteine desulfurase [Bacilli bacterium]|nr:cysteine desulfurase [Bacilli bacterium]